MTMKSILEFSQETFVHCCGVAEVGGFNYYKFNENDYVGNWYQPKPCEVESPGTGMFVSTFVNDDVCKEAYEYLCKNHTLLYQSPKFRNRGHNQVFLCVFKYRPKANKLPKGR